MNIKITYNWLLEYLDTDADPYELQKYLSLCGPSVERVEKIDNDYVLDIEVTSNRVDMASVLGIAQEATAILPQFGKQARLKFNPLSKYTFKNMNAEPATRKELHVEIKNQELVPRFSAIVYANIDIKPAPNFIQERLQLCDIKSINNIVDISNYLMLALGQPVHMFDYDKITGHKMIVRESRQGEKLITLDDKEIILPGGDIVIEDGEDRLIDLCGIMGGSNSAISNDTRNIVFFVQTYDKQKIRRTSMTTGQRTVAATYFEKDLDPERVEPTFVYGIDLLNEFSNGIADSQLYDIYPHPYKPKEIHISHDDITKIIGINIEVNRIKSILENLGFQVSEHTTHNPQPTTFKITIPSYRQFDVDIKEDIIEEVARVYGYHNLPNNIQPPVFLKQPKEIEKLFKVQSKIKYYLKHIGLNEVMNYSMISRELLENLDYNLQDHLKLSNTISEEIEYLRTSLFPSLLKNIQDNSGKKDILKFFEIAKIYKKRPNELPEEPYKLEITVNTDFFHLKGIIESLLQDLHITEYEIKPGKHHLFSPHIQAELYIKNKLAGTLGQVKNIYKTKLKLKENVYLAEIDLQDLIDNYKILAPYKPISSFATVKLDLTITQRKELPYSKIKSIAMSTSNLLKTIEMIDIFQDKLTLRFYLSSHARNITEEEAKKELTKIQEKII